MRRHSATSLTSHTSVDSSYRVGSTRRNSANKNNMSGFFRRASLTTATSQSEETATGPPSPPPQRLSSFDSGSSERKSGGFRYGGLARVGSRSNLNVWRGEGVVSEGGSMVLMGRARLRQRRTRRSLRNLKMTTTTNTTPAPTIHEKHQKREKLAYLNSFIRDLHWALAELGCIEDGGTVDWPALEGLAIFLDRALTQESNRYHNVAHVYQISAGASPLQVLAAFFRDVVKGLTADNGFFQHLDESVRAHLAGLFVDDDSNSKVVISPDLTDARDLLVVQIFGYQPGNDITQAKGGVLDMLCSAVVASRLLRDFLSLKLTAQLAACIEATIPFRPGQPLHLDVLHQRLVTCQASHPDLALSAEEMEQTVQEACDLWNRQVGNMVSEDMAVFLDHTWSLLPQHAVALQRRTLYTLADYHAAMISMHNFLTCLQHKPNQVYLEFRGIPTATELRTFHKRFQSNSAVAISFVRARLLSVALVSALACLTGGDGPKSYFFGDISSLNPDSVHLGELVPRIASGDAASSCDMKVFDLLTDGTWTNEDGDKTQLMDAGFDNRNTGVAAFLYAHLGEDLLPFAVKLATCTPMTMQASHKLLQSLPCDTVVAPILKAFGFMAVTRAPAAERLLTELQEAEAEALKTETTGLRVAIQEAYSSQRSALAGASSSSSLRRRRSSAGPEGLRRRHSVERRQRGLGFAVRRVLRAVRDRRQNRQQSHSPRLERDEQEMLPPPPQDDILRRVATTED